MLARFALGAASQKRNNQEEMCESISWFLQG